MKICNFDDFFVHFRRFFGFLYQNAPFSMFFDLFYIKIPQTAPILYQNAPISLIFRPFLYQNPPKPPKMRSKTRISPSYTPESEQLLRAHGARVIRSARSHVLLAMSATVSLVTFVQLTGVPFVVGNPWPGEWVAVVVCINRTV
jgi:hypothetical protein